MADSNELHCRTDAARTEFLHTDLDLCFTFADLALTELAMPEKEVAERVLAKAEKGYAVMMGFLPDVLNVQEYELLQRKLGELRVRLDYVRRQIGATA